VKPHPNSFELLMGNLDTRRSQPALRAIDGWPTNLEVIGTREGRRPPGNPLPRGLSK
jgi:hypothetical protein